MTYFSTASLSGSAAAFPEDLQTQIIQDSLVADPLLGALTLRRTNRQSVAFPYAQPSTDGAWQDEGKTLITLSPGDGLLSVTPLKLGVVLYATNESLRDSSFDVTSWLVGEISSSMVKTAAKDLLQGASVAGVSGVPAGAYATFTAASGATGASATLRENVIQSYAEVLEGSGIAPTHAVVSPSAFAAQLKAESTATTPYYAGPRSFAEDLGMQLVVSPALTGSQAFCFTAPKAFLVLRDDCTIAVSPDATGAFEADSVAIRVTARVDVAFVQPSLYVRACGTA